MVVELLGVFKNSLTGINKVRKLLLMQHNYALVKKFVEAGKQMDFFPYPMHKHNVTGKDRAHLIEKILTYILEKNK